MHRVIETSVIGTDDERRTLRGWLARRRLRSQLRRAREWTGTSVADGTLVRVTGSVRAVDDRVVLAPLSGRPCVYAWIEIRVILVFVPPDPALRGTGWSAVAGRIVASERTGVPFSIEDRGRRVIVDPDAADASLVFDRVSRTVTRSSDHWSRATAPAEPAQRALLERFGLGEETGWWTPAEGYEYREAIIAPGARVTVIGAATGSASEAVTTPFRDAWTARLQVQARWLDGVGRP